MSFIVPNRLIAVSTLTIVALWSSPAAHAQILSQNFDNVSTLGETGWSFQNLSDLPSTDSWFQGDTSAFTANSGAADSYAAADYLLTTGGTGTETLSVWMITPQITVKNGDTVSFFTRTVFSPGPPDRLELRFSAAGASTNVGTTSSSVGDFTTLLTTVNDGLTTSGYPEVWTQVTTTFSGLSGPTSGRLGFRYNVPNAGVAGDNSSYIGVDDLLVLVGAAVPEPSTLALMGLGVLVLIRNRRAR